MINSAHRARDLGGVLPLTQASACTVCASGDITLTQALITILASNSGFCLQPRLVGPGLAPNIYLTAACLQDTLLGHPCAIWRSQGCQVALSVLSVPLPCFSYSAGWLGAHCTLLHLVWSPGHLHFFLPHAQLVITCCQLSFQNNPQNHPFLHLRHLCPHPCCFTVSQPSSVSAILCGSCPFSC